jgi:hypothetical protein
MTRHARIPAFAALLITAASGVALLAATGQFRSANLAQISLDDLEKRIIDCKDPAVWCAYGDKLRIAGRFPAAAMAYQRAVDLQPDLTSARMNIAIVLGLANHADAFFAYFSKLSAAYPKLAVDLLDRPELSAMRSDSRWDPAASAARAQALD